MNPDQFEISIQLARKLQKEVLNAMKQVFIAKDEIIDLLGVALVARENLFLLGPPGTAKSALVHSLARRIHGEYFDYLLTRFTEPNELLGPFDIRRLREGELVTNTEGMLPEAHLVFLDELLNANSSILNSLLMILNERVFRRGRETRDLPTLMLVGASNRTPEEEALKALFDRFLLRAHCGLTPQDRLGEVLDSGWEMERMESEPSSLAKFQVEEIQKLQSALTHVEVHSIQSAYLELIGEIRNAGIELSDRRAVKAQRLIAASAMLMGRRTALVSDLWVLRYMWDTEEQMETLRGLVDERISKSEETELRHPRSLDQQEPDAEALGRELEKIESLLEQTEQPEHQEEDRIRSRSRLRTICSQVEWVRSDISREALTQRANQLWMRLKTE